MRQERCPYCGALQLDGRCPKPDCLGHRLPNLPPPAARRTDPDTNHAAAASMVEAAGEQARQTLEALQRLGKGIYTEIADEAGLAGWQVTRRLPELRTAGFIRRLDEKRPTPSGRLAHVYEVV